MRNSAHLFPSDAPFLSLDAACAALEEGRLLIFPTETFFALGCDAMNPDAVGSVFSLKQRAMTMPLPVVIGELEHLERVAAHVSPQARTLAERFWPGPLSLVLPARPDVPDLLTANAGRVAVRFSPHSAVRALCRAANKVLVASSANISGTPPVALPEALAPELTAGVAGFYGEGALPAGGLPSTVIDLVETREVPVVRILRAGAVTEQDFLDAGYVVQGPEEPESR